MLDIQEIPIAASSRRVYLSALAVLDKWLKGREVTDETLAGYLSYLFDRGKSPRHAEGVLKAVRWRFLSQDLPDPRGKRCRNALASFRRQAFDRGRGQVDGLTFEDVEMLISHATEEQTIYGYRDAVIFSVMSDAMLRVSEVTAIDIEHIDFNANTLFIPRSKTDQTGKGVTQYIGDQTLEHVRVWIEKAKLKDGPLLRAINKTYLYALKGRMYPDTIRKLIKARCRKVGIEGRISGHSFRVGTTQSLTTRGASLVELQICGRWTSPNMPAHYARRHTAQQSAVARLRYAQ